MRLDATSKRVLGVPVDRWDALLIQRTGGARSFEVPGRPDAPNVTPWPVQWCLLEVVPADCPDARAAARGYRPVSADCCVCAAEVSPDPFTGVRCCRCAVPLCFACAHMSPDDPLAIPVCEVCYPRTAELVKSRPALRVSE